MAVHFSDAALTLAYKKTQNIALAMAIAGMIIIAVIAGCSNQPKMDMRVVAKAGDLEFTLYDLELNLFP